MDSEWFERVGRVLGAYVTGETPDETDVRLLSEQPHREDILDPKALVDADDARLDALFRSSQTLGLERMVNTGVRKVDPARHEIYNDAYWKGFLPKGLPLGEMASRMYTGYYKRFWGEGNRFLGETRYLDGRVPVRHTLEEVVIEREVNDLTPGKYILLRYADAVFEHLFYDVMKIVSEDVVLYRGYVGQFPEGRRGWCAPLLRRYGFPQMDAEDHMSLYDAAGPAAADDLPGTWRLKLVANSNHADGGELRVEPGFKTEAKPGTPSLPGFIQDHFRVADARKLLGEMRTIDREVLIGRWMTGAQKLGDGSAGLLHATTAESGLAVYYLLYRSA